MVLTIAQPTNRNKSSKSKKYSKLKDPGYTLYYARIAQGMRTRSGKTINCILTNHEFVVDIDYFIKFMNTIVNPCLLIDTLCLFLDKYYEIMYEDRYLGKLYYEFNKILIDIEHLLKYKINSKVYNCNDYMLKILISSNLSPNLQITPSQRAHLMNFNRKCDHPHNNKDKLQKIINYRKNYTPYHYFHKKIYNFLVYKMNSDCVNKIFEYVTL